MKCVIFGGADISDYDSVRRYLPAERFFAAAADRGYIHCKKLGIIPDVLIGDFDSIDSISDIPADVKMIRAPHDKDDTDTLLAVKYVSENKMSRSFLIFGGTGGRFGHTFANVQTLSYISENGMEGIFFGDDYLMRNLTPKNGRKKFRSDEDIKYISIFSLSESSEISVEGLKYSGKISLERKFPLGVSNEPLGSEWYAEVFSGEILIIEEK